MKFANNLRKCCGGLNFIEAIFKAKSLIQNSNVCPRNRNVSIIKLDPTKFNFQNSKFELESDDFVLQYSEDNSVDSWLQKIEEEKLSLIGRDWAVTWNGVWW